MSETLLNSIIIIVAVLGLGAGLVFASGDLNPVNSKPPVAVEQTANSEATSSASASVSVNTTVATTTMATSTPEASVDTSANTNINNSATNNNNVAQTADTTITTYEVKAGDSIGAIARKFGVSVNTILWANNLSATSLIQPGEKLEILPVTGVMHKVASGENINVIANTYGADVNKILTANNISDPNKLKIGQELIIPGGTQTSSSVRKTTSVVSAKTSSSRSSSSASSKTAVTYHSGIPTTMAWSASGIAKVSNLAYYDESTYIRNSFVKKVERYARSKGITLITAQVIDNMHE